MYFWEQGNVDDDATLITIFLVSFNLHSCCLMQSANVIHRCRSSCPCYYSQIEGLGLHVVYIMHYVIRIEKQLHNRIKIIEIVSNRKEYESLHYYCHLQLGMTEMR